jgi:cytochrome b
MRVWDPAVRAIHWALAATCAAAWITTQAGLRWHEPLGYLALALVAVRVAWGFAGSGYARFSQFVRGPAATLAYAARVAEGNAPRYLGHNPLGGWMAIVLWTAIALLGLSGWLFSTDMFWGEAWLDRTHQWLGWTLLVLVMLHVGGVAHAARQHRESLVAAMVHGDKRPPAPGDIP